MSVDPKETQVFANILGRLNGVQQGTVSVDVNAGRAKRMADNDMTSILSAFNEKSGTASALTLTPEAITESAAKPDQVGAEFEPKTISPVLGEPEKLHPMDGMLVGEEEVDEEETKETVTVEDSLSDIKKRLGDYLQDIKSGAKVDDKELSKKANKEDQLGPAIKTITTDDGKTIKIHGNEDDGFRLKINEKMHSARFKSFDEAQMACETYVARRKSARENQDYAEEK